MPKITIPAQYVTTLSQKEQINELNSTVRCTLKPSNVHGVGVFTIRDIKQGERLYCTPHVIPTFYTVPFGSLKKLFPEVRELVLARWASVVNGSLFQNPNDDVGLLFFINHSSDNWNYDVVSDTALKDIPSGTEVLEDYRVMENWAKIYSWIEKID